MITLKQAKDYLTLGCSDYDSLIKEIIDYTVSYIHSYIGYSLEQKEELDYYKGTNRQFLPLGKSNVTAIASVKIDSELLDPSKYQIRKGMLFKRDMWDAKYIGKSLYDTSYVDYNIEVVFTYGYTYPNVDLSINNGNVPKELQYVCCEILKKIFIQCGTEQQVKSESGKRLDATFTTDYYEIKIKDLITKDIERILDKYKK